MEKPLVWPSQDRRPYGLLHTPDTYYLMYRGLNSRKHRTLDMDATGALVASRTPSLWTLLQEDKALSQ